jgi:hypothetical protein
MANQASSAAEAQTLSHQAPILIPEAARILFSQETTHAINFWAQDPPGDESPEMLRALERLEEFLHNAPTTGDITIPAELRDAVRTVVQEGCVGESLRAIHHEGVVDADFRQAQRERIATAEFWMSLADELEAPEAPAIQSPEELDAKLAERRATEDLGALARRWSGRLPDGDFATQLQRFEQYSVEDAGDDDAPGVGMGDGQHEALCALRDAAALVAAEFDELAPWGLAGRVIEREVRQSLDRDETSGEAGSWEAQARRDVMAVLDRHLPHLDPDSDWGQLWQELRDSLEEEEENLAAIPEEVAGQRISAFLRYVAGWMPYGSELRDLALRSSSRWARLAA